MSKFNDILHALHTFILITAVFVLLYFHFTDRGQNISNKYETFHSDTTVNNTTVQNIHYHKGDQIHVSDSVQIIEKEIDTAELFRIWAMQYVYNDQYRDSLIDIEITDTIYKNRITGRSLKYSANIPTRTITNYVQPKFSIYGGLQASQFGFGPSVHLGHKNFAFQTTLMFEKQRKYFTFGFYKKIK